MASVDAEVIPQPPEMAAWAGYPHGDEYALDEELGPGDAGGKVLRYDGSETIDGLPDRNDLIEAETSGVSEAVSRHSRERRKVFFMPVDVDETVDYRRGAPVYALRLYGHTLDGAKAEVTITDIEPFFDVLLTPSILVGGAGASAPSDEVERTWVALRQTVQGALSNETGSASARYETVEATPLLGWREAPAPWARVRLATLQHRKKALEAVRAAGLTTASDDRTCYYRKAARELGLPLSDWAVLSGYEYTPGHTARSPLSAHVYRVGASGYRALADAMAPKAAREASEATRARLPLLAKPRTLVCTWDIESRPRPGSTDLPRGNVPGDEAFMYCLTLHWLDDAAPLLQVCIAAAETAPDPRWLTVLARGPRDALRALAVCLRAFRPDVMVGFNDSGYDWPFVVEKAALLGELAWFWNQVTAAPRRDLEDSGVLKWNYREGQKIKLSAEAVLLCSYLKWQGCVPVDARACFKKLYPKSDNPKAGSLRFYLGLCRLPAKIDMPIKRMWWAYDRAVAAEAEAPDSRGPALAAAAECMRQVAHYCVIDALSCQRLLVRRAVLADYRAVSGIARVSFADSHYYAGGMKVCNLLAGRASERGIVVGMQARAGGEGKYLGAYVFPPQKGLVPNPVKLAAVERAAEALRGARARRPAAGPSPPGPLAAEEAAARAAVEAALADFADCRPVTGLDFASLYPSIIMTYNLSPEKVVFDPAEAAALEARGVSLHHVTEMFGGRRLDTWFVRHGNDPERIGLYPSVLIDLFARRAEVKVVLGQMADLKEIMNLVYGRAGKTGSVADALRGLLAEADERAASTGAALAPDAPPPRVSPGATLAEELADLRKQNRMAATQAAELRKHLAAGATDAEVEAAMAAEYQRVCFEWLCANTRQNALKVYMNSFYGETGNPLSPFYLLDLAIGVTSAGQYNIKAVAAFVREQGFTLMYGDTDSLYLIPPNELFAECDEAFVLGELDREGWWSASVRITMRSLNTLREKVNAFLKRDNGTDRLKMAYEEVLYPVVFTGKKKYYGIPHLNEVNFRPKELFIKGIDVVKVGLAGFAREIGLRVMWASMALENSKTLLEITQEVLREAVTNLDQWSFESFIMTDAWRPEKDNKSVQRFMARKQAAPPSAHCALPEPGERFSYVIVRTDALFDLRGCRVETKKGDRMEFARVAQAEGLQVDVPWYLISKVAGLCARFINSDPLFQAPAPRLPATEAQIAQADKTSQKAAKAWIETYLKSMGGADPLTLRKRGYAYRRAYKAAAAIAERALVEAVGATGASVLYGPWTSFESLIDPPEGMTGRGAVSAVVETLWTAAGGLADELSAAHFADWYQELSLAIGIGKDGADVPVGESAGPAPESRGSRNLYSLGRGAGRGRGGRGAGRPGRPDGVRCEWSSALDRCESANRAGLARLAPALREVAHRFEADLTRLVGAYRLEEHAVHPEIGQASPAGEPAPARGSAPGPVSDAAPARGSAPGPVSDAAPAPASAEPVPTSAEPVPTSLEPAEAAPVASGDPEPASGEVVLRLTQADRATLSEARVLWFEAVGIRLARQFALGFDDHLGRLRDKRTGAPPGMTKADAKKAIAEAASKRPTLGIV